MAHAAIAVALLGPAAGCSDDDPELACAPSTELAAILEPVHTLAATWDSGLTCQSAEDCVVIFPDVSCEDRNSFFGACPADAIHMGSLDDFAAEFEARREEACAQLPRDCFSGPACLPVAPRCIDGRCEAISTFDDAGTDASPPDASTDGSPADGGA